MAEIIITINDAHVTRALDGMAGHFGYRDEVDGEANPETKSAFAQRKLKQQMVQWVKRYEREQAIRALEITEVDIT